MSTKDGTQNQIRENRKIMRGLPPTSPTYKKLLEENVRLGSTGLEYDNTPRGGPAWIEIANILTELTNGADAKYSETPSEVEKALIKQETDRIWRLMWGIINANA